MLSNMDNVLLKNIRRERLNFGIKQIWIGV